MKFLFLINCCNNISDKLTLILIKKILELVKRNAQLIGWIVSNVDWACGVLGG